MTRVTLIAVAPPPAGDALIVGTEALPSRANLAKAAGAAVRFTGAKRVVRSPARSAAATAEALGHPHAQIEPALRDRSYGRWSGRPLTEIATDDPDGLRGLLRDPDAAAPDGESVSDLIRRMHAWLDVVAEYPGHLVAITHPEVIRACLVAAMEGPAALCFRLDVRHNCRSVLTSSGTGWRVRLMNGQL